MKPIQGAVYSLEVILTKLTLTDSPHLQVALGSPTNFVPVQDSHVRVEELLASGETLLSSTWRYLRTTYELIPVFKLVDTRLIPELFDIVDPDEEGDITITFKGFPMPKFDS